MAALKPNHHHVKWILPIIYLLSIEHQIRHIGKCCKEKQNWYWVPTLQRFVNFTKKVIQFVLPFSHLQWFNAQMPSTEKDMILQKCKSILSFSEIEIFHFCHLSEVMHTNMDPSIKRSVMSRKCFFAIIFWSSLPTCIHESNIEIPWQGVFIP